MPGTETWPMCVLIVAWSISNIPLLSLLFENVEMPHETAPPFIPIMVNDRFGQNANPGTDQG